MPGVAQAQDAGQGAEGVRVIQTELPSTLAQELLGQSGDGVVSSRTPADIAATLQTLVDGDGQVQPGVGVEFSMRGVGAGATDTSAYLDDPVVRRRANMSFSLATAGGEAGDVALAAGWRMVLHDGNDPLLDPAYQACGASGPSEIWEEMCVGPIRSHCESMDLPDGIPRESCEQAYRQTQRARIVAWCADVHGVAEEEASDDPSVRACVQEALGFSRAHETCVQSSYRECLEDVRDDPRWTHAFAIATGAAASVRFAEGRLGEPAFDALGWWLAAGVGTPDAPWQFDGTVRLRYAYADEALYARLGLRVRYGNDRIRWFFESGYDGEGGVVPVGTGVEVRIADVGWVELGIGGRIDTDESDAATLFALSNVSWGLAPIATGR